MHGSDCRGHRVPCFRGRVLSFRYLQVRVPGVISVTRLKLDTLRVTIGGETRTIESQAPRYAATFELESPDVLTSAAWAKAVDQERWPTQVRPHTRNRQHTLHQAVK
jgi:hypothetical protein